MFLFTNSDNHVEYAFNNPGGKLHATNNIIAFIFWTTL